MPEIIFTGGINDFLVRQYFHYYHWVWGNMKKYTVYAIKSKTIKHATGYIKIYSLVFSGISIRSVTFRSMISQMNILLLRIANCSYISTFFLPCINGRGTCFANPDVVASIILHYYFSFWSCSREIYAS